MPGCGLLVSLVRRLLLDLHPYGINDSDRIFSLNYNQVARKLVLKLTVIFRHLVKGGSISGILEISRCYPCVEKSFSSDVGDYKPISITPHLSKVI